MGSGAFPRKGFRKAAYVCNMQIAEKNRSFLPPLDFQLGAMQPDSYTAAKTHGRGPSGCGNHFYYGGPRPGPLRSSSFRSDPLAILFLFLGVYVITNDSVRSIALLPKLEVLYMVSCPLIDDAWLQYLENDYLLTGKNYKQEIDVTSMSSSSLISILKGHPDLQNLKASHCISKKVFNRSDVTPSVFESSILLTVMALMIEGLSNEYISKCSRLLRLKLGLCANISDKGIFHIGSKCSKLLELDLYRWAGFGDDGLAAISRVDDAPVFDGKTPMEVSASAFSDYMGNTITRYGTRRGAQLRYPSHQLETNLSGGNPLWGLGGPHDAPASLIPLRSSQPVDLVLVSSHLPCRPCPLRCFISIQRKWCVLPLLHQAELTAGFYRSNGHDRYDAFTVFVRNMNQVKLSSYDQAVEDEA
uniref:Neprosin PEP catalytic domain-containing protein n=1 Tax=Brassica campestris TaxID=3711 RepID=M4DTT7_BRACM